MAKRFGRNNFSEMMRNKLASLTATHLGTQPFAQDSGKPKLRTKDSDFIDKRRSFNAKWRNLVSISKRVRPLDPSPKPKGLAISNTLYHC